MLPLLLRPDCFGRCLVSFRSGVARVTSSKLLTDMNRRPGLVGLYFLTGITPYSPWSSAGQFRSAHGRRDDYTPSNSPSIFWPGASVTIAFFHDGLCPVKRVCPRARRRVLPVTLTVLTATTLIF